MRMDEDLRGFLESAALVIGLVLLGLSFLLIVANGGLAPNPCGACSSSAPEGVTITCSCPGGSSIPFAGPSFLLLAAVVLLSAALLLRRSKPS